MKNNSLDPQIKRIIKTLDKHTAFYSFRWHKREKPKAQWADWASKKTEQRHQNEPSYPTFKKRQLFSRLHVWTQNTFHFFNLIMNLPFNLMIQPLPQEKFLLQELSNKKATTCSVIIIPFNQGKQQHYSQIIDNIRNSCFTGILLMPQIAYFFSLFRLCNNLLKLPPNIITSISKKPHLPRVPWVAAFLDNGTPV